jgi:hypothetical protein
VVLVEVVVGQVVPEEPVELVELQMVEQVQLEVMPPVVTEELILGEAVVVELILLVPEETAVRG